MARIQNAGLKVIRNGRINQSGGSDSPYSGNDWSLANLVYYPIRLVFRGIVFDTCIDCIYDVNSDGAFLLHFRSEEDKLKFLLTNHNDDDCCRGYLVSPSARY